MLSRLGRFLPGLGPLAMLAAVACTQGPYDDPLAVMLDRDRAFRFRRRAAIQARCQLGDDPRRVAALHRLVWEPGYPHWQRREAIDELVRIDEAAFRRVLARRITRVDQAATLDHIFGLALARRWEGFAPTVIRSYARPDPDTPDPQRPEHRLIQQLHPRRRVEQVVWAVLNSSDEPVDEVAQRAAWGVLVRLLDRAALAESLRELPARSRLANDLKACLSELSILPLEQEELLRLSYLRHPTRRAVWQEAGSWVNRLNASQRTGLALRHLPLLARRGQRLLSVSREDLLERVTKRIPLNGSLVGSVDADRSPAGEPRRSWRDTVSWADLMVLEQVLDAMEDPGVTRALFEQADADHADRRSEHGGVLEFATERCVARGYRPVLVRHDRVFYPPPEMIESLYTSLAHYHFHAQAHRNDVFARPGGGDRRFADRMNMNCVLLTFLNTDRLAASYYQRGGVTVELGVLNRGPGRGPAQTR